MVDEWGLLGPPEVMDTTLSLVRWWSIRAAGLALLLVGVRHRVAKAAYDHGLMATAGAMLGLAMVLPFVVRGDGADLVRSVATLVAALLYWAAFVTAIPTGRLHELDRNPQESQNT